MITGTTITASLLCSPTKNSIGVHEMDEMNVYSVTDNRSVLKLYFSMYFELSVEISKEQTILKI